MQKPTGTGISNTFVTRSNLSARYSINECTGQPRRSFHPSANALSPGGWERARVYKAEGSHCFPTSLSAGAKHFFFFCSPSSFSPFIHHVCVVAAVTKSEQTTPRARRQREGRLFVSGSRTFAQPHGLNTQTARVGVPAVRFPQGIRRARGSVCYYCVHEPKLIRDDTHVSHQARVALKPGDAAALSLPVVQTCSSDVTFPIHN